MKAAWDSALKIQDGTTQELVENMQTHPNAKTDEILRFERELSGHATPLEILA